MFASISAWFRNSLTLLWARVLMALAIITQVAMVFGNIPEVNTIVSLLFGPQTAALSVAVIGLVTELTRRRTALSVEPPGV